VDNADATQKHLCALTCGMIRYLRTALLLTTMALGTIAAQTATDTSNPSASTNNMNTRNDDSRGFDYGWLGLLGLAGLLGFRRRDVHTHQGTATLPGVPSGK
jgi:MYXO-CTERM domain-containing protein